MPRRNAFIRKADVEIWDSIANRPEWLHKVLQEYKNVHLGGDLTDTEFEKTSEKNIADSSDPLPQIIAGIEDAES